MISEYTEISDLDARIAELQAKRQAILDEKRTSSLVEVKAAIQQFGFTAADLGLSNLEGSKKGSVSTGKKVLIPKYANPSNHVQTWHGGKGAKPKWVKEYLSNGGNLEDALIKA